MSTEVEHHEESEKERVDRELSELVNEVPGSDTRSGGLVLLLFAVSGAVFLVGDICTRGGSAAGALIAG